MKPNLSFLLVIELGLNLLEVLLEVSEDFSFEGLALSLDIHLDILPVITELLESIERCLQFKGLLPVASFEFEFSARA